MGMAITISSERIGDPTKYLREDYKLKCQGFLLACHIYRLGNILRFPREYFWFYVTFAPMVGGTRA
jgi:hypothetical protein